MVLETMQIASNWPQHWPSPSLDATERRHHDWTKRRRSKLSNPQQSPHLPQSSSLVNHSQAVPVVMLPSRRPLRRLSPSIYVVHLLCLVLVSALCWPTATGLLLEPSIQTVGGDTAPGAGSPVVAEDGLNFNMENKIAAIFSRVSYGSTTTKRSISDSVVQSSLTTIPTPFLTTYR